MIARDLLPVLSASRKSLLLLGPRQTGKSTLVRQIAPDLSINLAHEPTYLEYLRNPRQLEEVLKANPRARSIFIDEVQRLPSLLNTIQTLLDNPSNRLKFILTGSSARKLRRGHANLLPGRIHTYNLGPLTCGELGNDIDSTKAMSVGTLPGIWTEPDTRTAQKTLRSYASTYVREEVQAENLARNLEGFTRFLHVAAEGSGRFLDLAKLSSAAQIPRQSAVRFFEVLEDCLLVHRIDSFGGGLTRKLVKHPRYYFFDTGVLNGLLGSFEASADRIGSLFENLVVMQIRHTAEALDLPVRLTTYRTEHGAEVDVVVECGREIWAIEIKSARSLPSPDLRGFTSFSETLGKPHQAAIFYNGDQHRRIRNVNVWPWQEGISKMFAALAG